MAGEVEPPAQGEAVGVVAGVACVKVELVAPLLAGEPKYIEVNTTRGTAETPFFVTANEVAFSEAHADEYHLYQVYNNDDERNAGMYYAKSGTIRSGFKLTPTLFRAPPRAKQWENGADQDQVRAAPA